MPTPAITHTVSHAVSVTQSPTDYIAVITLLLPLLTFGLGYLLNDIVEQRKEHKRLRQVKEYYFLLMGDLARAIGTQAEALRSAADELKSFTSGNYMIGTVISLQTERIKAIPNLDLYKIFIEGKPDTKANTELLLRASGAIDFIEEAKKRIRAINDDVLSKIRDFSGEFGKNVDFIFKENARLVMNYREQQREPDEQTDKLLKSITRAVTERLEERLANQNTPTIYETFVKPLYESAKDIKENSTTYELLSTIYKVNGKYGDIQKYKTHIVAQMTAVASQLNSIRKEVENINAQYITDQKS